MAIFRNVIKRVTSVSFFLLSSGCLFAQEPGNSWLKINEFGYKLGSVKIGTKDNDTLEVAAEKKVVKDSQGAIIRGDNTKKEIALVFTGDEFADGAEVIGKTLRDQKTLASFFFTGNFYRNPDFKKAIIKLAADGHYLGAHSDKHLLYADWAKRDSLLVTENQFKKDLRDNYKLMATLGIKKDNAKYFLPPYEWYNKQIVNWTKQEGLTLINFTPGTRTPADYTYPGMGARYLSAEAIYNSVLIYEKKDPNGLNGFILLVHIGTDPRRTDKFYSRLGELLSELSRKGYRFTRIDKLLE